MGWCFSRTQERRNFEIYKKAMPDPLCSRLAQKIDPINVDEPNFQKFLFEKIIRRATRKSRYICFLRSVANIYDFTITLSKFIKGVESENKKEPESIKKIIEIISRTSKFSYNDFIKLHDLVQKRAEELNQKNCDPFSIFLEKFIILSQIYDPEQTLNYFYRGISNLEEREIKEQRFYICLLEKMDYVNLSKIFGPLLLTDYGVTLFSSNSIQNKPLKIKSVQTLGALRIHFGLDSAFSTKEGFEGLAVGLNLYVSELREFIFPQESMIKAHEIQHGLDHLMFPSSCYDWRTEYRARLSELLILSDEEIELYNKLLNQIDERKTNGYQYRSKIHETANKKIKKLLAQNPTLARIKEELNQEYRRLTGFLGFYGLDFDEILEPFSDDLILKSA